MVHAWDSGTQAPVNALREECHMSQDQNSNDDDVPLAALAPDAPAPAGVSSPAAKPVPPGTRGVFVTRTSPQPRDTGFGGLAALMLFGGLSILLFAAIVGSYVAGRFSTEVPTPATPPPVPAQEAAAPAAAAPAAAAAIPEGAGIVSEVVEGRPKVSVYFDVGKADIASEFAASVAPIKAWLDENGSDRVQLSGFTDPTGNAAANAELAKNRAQAVAAALAAEGVANERIDLVKPADTSDQTADMSAARRVEITVTGG